MGQFAKGHKKVGGKQKGVPNKLTKEVREAYKTLVENNLDNMQEWMDRIAKKDPEKAFDVMIKMSEYFIPKLARTEIKQDGDNQVQTIKIEWVEGKRSI